MSPLLSSLISVVGVSVVSLVGVFLFALNDTTIRKWMMPLVGFSTGAILGDVFLHIVPEMLEESARLQTSMVLVLLGILISFIIEHIVHWHHCHTPEAEHHHIHPIGVMTIVGDGVHNMVDGILIATAWLVDPTLGFATTIAVVLHEIPQEFADFALLLHSGFSRSKAILWNALSACTAIVGALLVFVAAGSVENISQYLLPLAAGNFLYLAGTDLIPELHKETDMKKAIIQLLMMMVGIAVMYALLLLE